MLHIVNHIASKLLIMKNLIFTIFLIISCNYATIFCFDVIETHLYDNSVIDSIHLKHSVLSFVNIIDDIDTYKFLYSQQKQNDAKRIKFLTLNNDFSFDKLTQTDINFHFLDCFKDENNNFHFFGKYLDSSKIYLQNYGYAKLWVSNNFEEIIYNRMDYGKTSFLNLSFNNTQLLESILEKDSLGKRIAWLNTYDTSFILQEKIKISDENIFGGVNSIHKSSNYYYYYLNLVVSGGCGNCGEVLLYKLDNKLKKIDSISIGTSINEYYSLTDVSKDDYFLVNRTDYSGPKNIVYKPVNSIVYNKNGKFIFSSDTLNKVSEESVTIDGEFLYGNHYLIQIENKNDEHNYYLRFYNNEGNLLSRVLFYNQNVDTTILSSYKLKEFGNNSYFLYCKQTDGSGDTNKVIGTGVRIFLLDLTNGVKPVISEFSDNLVYPNPTKDYITIDLSNTTLKCTVEVQFIRIFDAIGNEVLTVPKENTLETQCIAALQKINVSALPPGVYFVSIGDVVQKFVKI